jgi:putative flippase GtrA
MEYSMLNKFGKFFIMAVINGVLTGTLLFVFTSIFHIWYILSAGLTVLVLVPLGFTYNTLITWRSKKKQAKEITTIYRFLKYCIVGVITVIMGFGMLYILTDVFHLWYLVSYLIGSGLVIICTFLAHFYWTWGNSENKELDFIISILKKTRLILVINRLGIKA